MFISTLLPWPEVFNVSLNGCMGGLKEGKEKKRICPEDIVMRIDGNWKYEFIFTTLNGILRYSHGNVLMEFFK